MPKKGRNIYKRKDGRWEGRYRRGGHDDGKTLYGYLYGKTYAEVSQRLEAIEQREKKEAEGQKEQNSRILAEVAHQWLSMMSLKLKPSTSACYAAALETHILPALGSREIQQLSGGDISSYAREKLETGRADGQGGLSVKTVRDLLSIIKAIGDYAYKEQMIQNRFAVVYPPLPKNEMRVLTRQEQSALVAVLVGDMDIFKLGILTCLYTGLRVGEVCALRWQDFSEDFDTLTVRQTIQRVRSSGQGTEGVGRKGEGKDVEKEKNEEKKGSGKDGRKTEILLGAPKSIKSERTIPVPQFLAPFLRKFAGEGGDDRLSNGYLLSMEGMVFTEPRTMQNHFIRNIREAGIEDANYHSLRHTFATRCIEAGVDVKSLSEILGHANVNITLSRYVHSSIDQKRSCMERLEQYAGLP